MHDPVQDEACRNARLLSRLCDLLEGERTTHGQLDESGHGHPELQPSPRSLEDVRSHIYAERKEFMRDYDPDVDGWPWETPYL